MLREEAIKYIRNILKGREDKRGKTEIDVALEMSIEALKQQTKTAYWITTPCWYSNYCSHCNCKSENRTNYCPDCGYKMIGTQESEG